jgi:hypothetical protein
MRQIPLLSGNRHSAQIKIAGRTKEEIATCVKHLVEKKYATGQRDNILDSTVSGWFDLGVTYEGQRQVREALRPAFANFAHTHWMWIVGIAVTALGVMAAMLR